MSKAPRAFRLDDPNVSWSDAGTPPPGTGVLVTDTDDESVFEDAERRAERAEGGHLISVVVGQGRHGLAGTAHLRAQSGTHRPHATGGAARGGGCRAAAARIADRDDDR